MHVEEVFYEICLQIKTFTNKNFNFSMGAIFWLRIFMLKERYR